MRLYFESFTKKAEDLNKTKQSPEVVWDDALKFGKIIHKITLHNENGVRLQLSCRIRANISTISYKLGVFGTYIFGNAGMANTWFGAHCKDSDLASCNYLHYDEPKSWIGVPYDETEKLETIMNIILNEITNAAQFGNINVSYPQKNY